MGVPRIETGPLTVKDFLAFTEGRPDEERWELIAGAAVMNAAPVRTRQIILCNIIYCLKSARRNVNAGWEAIPGIGVSVSQTSASVPDFLVRPNVPADHVCDDMIVARNSVALHGWSRPVFETSGLCEPAGIAAICRHRCRCAGDRNLRLVYGVPRTADRRARRCADSVRARPRPAACGNLRGRAVGVMIPKPDTR